MSTELNTLFRKKPVVIEAFQLPAAGADVLEAFHLWCERVGFANFTSGRDETLEVETLEGTMTAQPGDWIIRGVKGEFYPCKPDIFTATYESAAIPTHQAEMGDVMQGVDGLLREAYAHWDADCELKVGKILLALIGHNKGYDKRAEAWCAAFKASQPVERKDGPA